MAKDKYSSFDELQNHEAPDKDYQLYICDAGSRVTIIAPHGGKIEPRTSDLAKRIARENYNCYCFEGLKEKGALVIVPSSAVDTMNLGGLSGMVSLAQNTERNQKEYKE